MSVCVHMVPLSDTCADCWEVRAPDPEGKWFDDDEEDWPSNDDEWRMHL